MHLSDTEQKPDIKPDVNEKMMLIVRHEDKEIKIALKPHHAMQKLFEAAGKAFQMDYSTHAHYNSVRYAYPENRTGTLKFVYNNQRLRPDDTVASMEMEDGDEISAFLEQLGGSSAL
ncbi:hypothetical protein ACEPAI_1797 [Sanghuangporus weigelae]